MRALLFILALCTLAPILQAALRVLKMERVDGNFVPATPAPDVK
jgi:hypothetical protein